MSIQEDYVSFETAKLLKEKGFDERCTHYYKNEKYLVDLGYTNIHSYTNSDLVEEFAAPTLQMAMKWLREVHKLWIDFSVFCPAPEGMHKHEDCIPRYFYRIKKYNIGYMDFITSDEHILNFPSYEQAVEAAIKYCLENLIK